VWSGRRAGGPYRVQNDVKGQAVWLGRGKSAYSAFLIKGLLTITVHG
jgi:hypothetical protein